MRIVIGATFIKRQKKTNEIDTRIGKLQIVFFIQKKEKGIRYSRFWGEGEKSLFVVFFK